MEEDWRKQSEQSSDQVEFANVTTGFGFLLLFFLSGE
jgi:hypothetical protein